MRCLNFLCVLCFVVLISQQFVTVTFSLPLSRVVDTSAQNMAQLKNTSYVYMVYNGSSSCYPHCRALVSYPAIPLYGDSTYLLHTTRRLIDVLNDISSDVIKDDMLVCAMPSYLITQMMKTDRVLNCTTVNDLSEVVLPKDLITLGTRQSDDNEYIDPFNPPNLDVGDAFNTYNDYGNNDEQSGDYGNEVEDYSSGDYGNDVEDYSNNSEDYSNNVEDYSNDVGDYEEQSGAGNIPDYGQQQTIDANSRVGVESNTQVEDTSSNDSQCPGGGLHECIDVCPSSNLIAFKVCVNVCVKRCP